MFNEHIQGTSTAVGDVYTDAESVTAVVKEYYGKILSNTKDLKTSACTTCSKPPAAVAAALKNVPSEVLERFYGCGNPVPSAGIEGLHVLDLGCGSGRDCYVAAQFVGPTGRVTGIDMTDELLGVARRSMDAFSAKTKGGAASNVRFLKGYIEDVKGAGVEDCSVDICISNCVVNLSPNKPAVLRGVYNALKFGGEFHFSDVYCDRRLPDAARKDDLLFGECIGGAMYIGDFVALCKETGFADPRVLSLHEIGIHDPEMKKLLAGAKFYSITYRLFKLPVGRLEPQSEDYGQVAYYKGSLVNSASPIENLDGYRLDDHHYFETNRPVLVCGNTASMLEETWLKPHFRVAGDRTQHFGVFPCGTGYGNNSAEPAPAVAQAPPSASAGGCSGGSCC